MEHVEMDFLAHFGMDFEIRLQLVQLRLNLLDEVVLDDVSISSDEGIGSDESFEDIDEAMDELEAFANEEQNLEESNEEESPEEPDYNDGLQDDREIPPTPCSYSSNCQETLKTDAPSTSQAESPFAYCTEDSISSVKIPKLELNNRRHAAAPAPPPRSSSGLDVFGRKSSVDPFAVVSRPQKAEEHEIKISKMNTENPCDEQGSSTLTCFQNQSKIRKSTSPSKEEEDEMPPATNVIVPQEEVTSSQSVFECLLNCVKRLVCCCCSTDDSRDEMFIGRMRVNPSSSTEQLELNNRRHAAAPAPPPRSSSGLDVFGRKSSVDPFAVVSRPQKAEEHEIKISKMDREIPPTPCSYSSNCQETLKTDAPSTSQAESPFAYCTEDSISSVKIPKLELNNRRHAAAPAPPPRSSSGLDVFGRKSSVDPFAVVSRPQKAEEHEIKISKMNTENPCDEQGSSTLTCFQNQSKIRKSTSPSKEEEDEMPPATNVIVPQEEVTSSQSVFECLLNCVKRLVCCCCSTDDSRDEMFIGRMRVNPSSSTEQLELNNRRHAAAPAPPPRSSSGLDVFGRKSSVDPFAVVSRPQKAEEHEIKISKMDREIPPTPCSYSSNCQETLKTDAPSTSQAESPFAYCTEDSISSVKIPKPSVECEFSSHGDPFADHRILMAIVDASSPVPEKHYSSVQIVSLSTGAVIQIKFDEQVLGLNVSQNYLMVSLSTRVFIYDIVAFSELCHVTTEPPMENSAPTAAICGQMLAYADSRLNVEVQSAGGLAAEVESTNSDTDTDQVFSAVNMISRTVKLFGESVGATVSGTAASKNTIAKGIVTIRNLLAQKNEPNDDVLCHCIAHVDGVSYIDFSPDQRLVLTADTTATVFNVFLLLPHSLTSTFASVEHFYKFNSGSTMAKVTSTAFSIDSRWLPVGTNHGTYLAFAICPFGEKPTQRTHGDLFMNKESRFHRSAGLALGPSRQRAASTSFSYVKEHPVAVKNKILARTNNADLHAPMPIGSPIINIATKFEQKENRKPGEEMWTPHVETRTYQPPHRWIWQGPQFEFYVYKEDDSAVLMSPHDSRGNSPAPYKSIPVVIGGGISIASNTNVPSDAKRIECGSYSSSNSFSFSTNYEPSEISLKIADAMREVPSTSPVDRDPNEIDQIEEFLETHSPSFTRHGSSKSSSMNSKKAPPTCAPPPPPKPQKDDLDDLGDFELEDGDI